MSHPDLLILLCLSTHLSYFAPVCTYHCLVHTSSFLTSMQVYIYLSKLPLACAIFSGCSRVTSRHIPLSNATSFLCDDIQQNRGRPVTSHKIYITFWPYIAMNADAPVRTNTINPIPSQYLQYSLASVK